MNKTGRVLLGSLAMSVATITASTTPATADARHCFARAPISVGDYQSVTDRRDVNFGIGDVTSVVKLPDGRRFFALGDTAYYGLNGDGSAGPLKGFGNNSAWVQSGSCVTLLGRSGPGTRSWVLPPQQDGSFYWPGASVVVGPRLYVFMQRLVMNTTFGTSVGAAVAAFDLPSLKLARLTPIPWMAKRVFGGGAVYDGGYVYTYASQGRTCGFCFAGDMYVARVPESQIMVPSAWRFRSASSWVSDRNAATPVLRAAVSNTDVQQYGNGFLLITKTVSIIGPPVEAWWAPNPDGPWRDLGTVYSVPSPPPARVSGYSYRQAYTYNPVVLANTRLADGGLLGSYNVNSFDPADAQRDGRMFGPRFVSITVPAAPSAPPRATSSPGISPWTPTFAVDGAGRVRTLGGGAAFDRSYTAHAVAVARTPTARGGWIAAADGGVFAYGDAKFYGSMGGVRLNQPIVGMAATPTGGGYWLVARDGGIFTFGDGHFYGSTGAIKLNQPIDGITTSPTGKGYRLVAHDGGIFSFGDAPFYGSLPGIGANVTDVVGTASSPTNKGYWIAEADGVVHAFGDAQNFGSYAPSLCDIPTAIFSNPKAQGYRLVLRSGATVAFGHAPGGGGSTGTPRPCSTPPPPPAHTTFGDGVYQVGVNLAAGTYRTRLNTPGCYWERLSGFGGSTGDIISNDFTNETAVVTISASDKGFHSSGCGTWTNDFSPITSSPGAPFTAGTYIVGTDVASGIWRSSGGSGCYWERESGFSGELADIITNDFTNTNAIVTISPSDRGFKATAPCGTWTKIG